MSTRTSTLRRYTARTGVAQPAATGFRVLAALTTLATYLLIVLGGTVRVTGSGEACPDWPTCQGHIVPSFNQHVLIEYSHRLSASVVSILVVLLAVAALWVWRQPRYLKILAGAAVGLLILQVLLGAVTVKADLPPQIVTAHLATATLLLGVLSAITVYAFTGRPSERDPQARRFSRAAMMAATGTLLLILTGSYVVGSDASLACHTWPLCNGQVVPTGGLQGVDINFFHRLVALLVGLGIVAVFVRALRERRGGALLTLAALALVVYLAQALVGAGNVWFKLTAGIRILHLALAEALWLVTAVLTVLATTLTRRTDADAAGPAAIVRPSAPLPSSARRPRFGDRVRPDDGAASGGEPS